MGESEMHNAPRAIAIAVCAALGSTVAVAEKRPSAPPVVGGNVVDASGRTLGPVFGPETTPNGFRVLRSIISVNGVVTSVALAKWPTFAQLVPASDGNTVFYSTPDCLGQPYIAWYGVEGTAPSATVADNRGYGLLFVADATAQLAHLDYQSTGTPGACTNKVGPAAVVPVTQVLDLSTLYLAPYSIR